MTPPACFLVVMAALASPGLAAYQCPPLQKNIVLSPGQVFSDLATTEGSTSPVYPGSGTCLADGATNPTSLDKVIYYGLSTTVADTLFLGTCASGMRAIFVYTNDANCSSSWVCVAHKSRNFDGDPTQFSCPESQFEALASFAATPGQSYYVVVSTKQVAYGPNNGLGDVAPGQFTIAFRQPAAASAAPSPVFGVTPSTPVTTTTSGGTSPGTGTSGLSSSSSSSDTSTTAGAVAGVLGGVGMLTAVLTGYFCCSKQGGAACERLGLSAGGQRCHCCRKEVTQLTVNQHIGGESAGLDKKAAGGLSSGSSYTAGYTAPSRSSASSLTAGGHTAPRGRPGQFAPLEEGTSYYDSFDDDSQSLEEI